MKFGKKIQEAAAASTDLCKEECWLNYKLLKKLLKEMHGLSSPPPEEDQEAAFRKSVAQSVRPPRQLKRLRNSNLGSAGGAEIRIHPEERRFFACLQEELKKVCAVYTRLESHALTSSLSLVLRIRKAACAADFQVGPQAVEA
jgi:hypothetical protein